MTMKMLLAALGTVALLSTAMAQTPPTSKAPRSPKSIECSKQADAKGLHGKARRTFRRQCIRAK